MSDLTKRANNGGTEVVMSHEIGSHAYVNRRARLRATLLSQKSVDAIGFALGVAFIVWLSFALGVL